MRVDERGFIPVDADAHQRAAHLRDRRHRRPADARAQGDARGQGRGRGGGRAASSVFDAQVIPSVAYTDPEVAWVGLTENEAKAKGDQVRQGRVPLGGERALAVARPRRGRHQAAVRRGDRPPASAAASSARTPAT